MCCTVEVHCHWGLLQHIDLHPNLAPDMLEAPLQHWPLLLVKGSPWVTSHCNIALACTVIHQWFSPLPQSPQTLPYHHHPGHTVKQVTAVLCWKRQQLRLQSQCNTLPLSLHPVYLHRYFYVPITSTKSFGYFWMYTLHCVESLRDFQKESDQSPHENKLVQQTCLHWNISPHLLSSVHVCNHLTDHGVLGLAFHTALWSSALWSSAVIQLLSCYLPWSFEFHYP